MIKKLLSIGLLLTGLLFVSPVYAKDWDIQVCTIESMTINDLKEESSETDISEYLSFKNKKVYNEIKDFLYEDYGFILTIVPSPIGSSKRIWCTWIEE